MFYVSMSLCVKRKKLSVANLNVTTKLYIKTVANFICCL